jgi:hypothetical protein
MEDTENLYDKIKEMFGGIPGQFNILEQEIDLDLQLNYFDLSRNVKGNLGEEDVLTDAERLFGYNADQEETKKILCRLASVEKPEAYRLIEKYLKSAENDLHAWASLALQESRMLLESRLLDESQVFISTGLGGKDGKLRYFIVLLGKGISSFSLLQQKLIREELELSLKRNDSELESITFEGTLVSALAIIPLRVTIKELFDKAIAECNLYGDFLHPNFIITNVKKLSYDEIFDFLKKQEFYS